MKELLKNFCARHLDTNFTEDVLWWEVTVTGHAYINYLISPSSFSSRLMSLMGSGKKETLKSNYT